MDYAAWHSVVTDDNGAVVPQATITVRHTDTGALARLYNARDGSEPKGNPFQTGADGMISFFAAGGAYTVIASKGTLERRWSFVPIGTAQEYDIDSLAEYLNSGVIYHQTYADMASSQPSQFPAASVVLADPDGSKNGYYTNDGSGWLFARTMPDSIARATIYNNTDVNSPKANISQGINPSSPIVFFLDVASPNTGSVTLTIDGIGTGTVLNAAGNVLSAGEWLGRVMLTREQDGRFRIVNDPASAIAAALSATQAGEARDDAITAKDLAEIFADDASESADNAAVSEGNAASSAANAAGSATAAENSATAAAGSASTASTKASEASSSASDAALSASTASTKADEAASSATAAASSATTATNQANRAEDEADRAEAAAGGLINAVQFVPQTLTTAQQEQAKKNIAADIVFDSKVTLEAAEVSASTHAVRLNGYDALGDGLGGMYIDTDNGSTDTILSGDGRTWYRVRRGESIYKKRVVKQLPLIWDGAPVLTSPDYWYPQGMSYDGDGNLYIHYLSNSLSAVVVYDNTYNFMRWFSVPSTLESIVAKGRLSNGTLKLYLRGTSNRLQEYVIAALPANGSAITPTNTVIPDNVGSQFTYGNGQWIVESIAGDYGAIWSRTVYGIYDDNFNRTGTINFPKTVVGARNADAAIYPHIPKSQGIAVKDGSIFIGIGGSFIPDNDPPPAPYVADIGYARLSVDGMSVVEYGVVKAEEFRISLQGMGYEAGRTESEGVCFHPSGELHTLFIGGRPSSPTAKQSGILIISEGDENGEDYSSIKTNFTPVNLSYYESHFPRDMSGGLTDPLTGKPIGSLSELLDWLQDVQVLNGTSYYSGLVSLPLLSGMRTPASSYRVEIKSFNGLRFQVRLTGYGLPNAEIDYIVTGVRGDWVASQITSKEVNDLILGQTQSNGDFYGRLLCRERISGDLYNVIYAYASASSNNITIGGGTLAGNAANQIMFATASTIGVDSGTVRWRINSSGNFRPEADNAYNFGAPSERVKDIYAANGTINTSDARKKTEITPLDEREISASIQLSKEIGIYKFLSAVSDKGDEARNHIGMTVQRAIEIMEDNGLNPMAYGFICYDEWEERQAEYDDEGNEIEPYRAAGSIYSFRHDELLLFIARGIDERLTRLEDNNG